MTKTTEWQNRFHALADDREVLMVQLEAKQKERKDLEDTIAERMATLRKEILALKMQIGPIDQERSALAGLLSGKTGPDPKVGRRKAG